ncbi:MAG: DUF1570 domain-containing protein [Burkholderiales bacterium]|nr:DUF1570 domain-containing protein [Burkholderiales bacterium]
MQRGRRLLLALLMAGVAICAIPARAAQWQRAESPHFRALARGSGPAVQQRIRNLERLHHAMLMTLGVTDGRGLSRPPFEMVMKDDDNVVASVFPHLRDRASGVFTLGADGALAFSSIWLDQGRIDYSGMVVYHEYAHRVMAQYARIGYPVWYVEGFAEYFGATYMDADGVEIGAVPTSSRVLDQRRWLEAPQLLKPAFKSSGEKGIDETTIHVFYAQSWLLTHYMLGDSARTRRFNEYFRRISAGEDALTAFEPATGIALAQLNDELRRYRDKMYASRLPNSELPAVEVRVTPVPQAEAEVEFDGLIIKAQPEAGVGKAVLERLRERVGQAGGNRAPDVMRWALAHAEIRYGDADRALQILAPWAQREEAPFDAQRLLGWAWQAVAAHSEGADRTQALEQARAFLMAAYKQRRNDAPTLYQLARVLYSKGPGASLSNAAEAASVLEPQVSDYALLAVAVHLESGNRDKALRPLQSLASNPHGGEGTERARAALQALQSNQEASTVLALLNGSKKPNSP